jgi:N-acetylmuramoyl-L-alanine amidase
VRSRQLHDGLEKLTKAIREVEVVVETMRASIGIEMCVNRGNNLDSTIDRTAQLTARLMRQYDISLNHVVPHMHWRMIRYNDGRDLGFKKCPRILLDGGRLGPKWSAFMAKVSFYAR